VNKWIDAKGAEFTIGDYVVRDVVGQPWEYTNLYKVTGNLFGGIRVEACLEAIKPMSSCEAGAVIKLPLTTTPSRKQFETLLILLGLRNQPQKN
jgi:hypothetical protein